MEVNNMTKVTLSTVDTRKNVIVEDATTVQQILQDNGVNYATASVMIDGMTLTPDRLRQSLSELGATGECTIATVIKMDNAGN